jgi:hypothetical protein
VSRLWCENFEQIVLFVSYPVYANLQAKLVGELHSLIFCWKLSRQIGLGFALPGQAVVDA